MAKSNWMKDEDQKGNFSNQQQDTFEPAKNFIGIRLQQGVPLLDRDWNELEDIRRYAEVVLRKYYIGNGVPDETGFKIDAADPPSNDFRIASGRCLVEGFEVVNDPVDPEGNRVGFILYSYQEGAAPLTVPDADRSDTVYLDVRIEEVTGANEPALNNPQDVDMETCIRHKLCWKVRVDEGSSGNPQDAFHWYYPIACIQRKAGKAAVEAADITDLRRTGLALYLLKAALDLLTGQTNADAQHTHSRLVGPGGTSAPALLVDQNGNVGIGETNPDVRLVVGGVIDPAIRMTSTDGSTGFIQTLQEHGGVRLYDGKEYIMHWKDGNVGIGTPEPGKKLDVNGNARVSVLEFNGGTSDSGVPPHHYAIYQEAGPQVAPYPDLVIAYHTGIKIGGHHNYNGTRFYNDAPQNEGATEIMSVGKGDNNIRINNDLMVNGNVGIGTTEPQKNVHIQGACSATFINDGNDRPGLAITGAYPELDLFSAAANLNHGPTIRMGSYNDDSITTFKHWSIGTSGRNSRFLDFGVGPNSDPNPHDGIRNHNGKTVMTLVENGNVGIGTLEPQKGIHIKGASSATFINDGNDRPGLAITGAYPELDLFSAAANSNHGPTIRMGGYNDDSITTFKHWVIGTSGRNSSFLDFGFGPNNDPNPHAGIRNYNGKTVMTLLENGNVGIGTLGPVHRLQVEGSLHVRNWATVGADYSEYFESKDGKSMPAGISVVMENGKIRRANKNEEPMGIISANPGMAAGVHVEWPKKYLYDEFGSQIMEECKGEILVPKIVKVKKERQKVKKKKVKETLKRTEIVKKNGKYCQVEIEETVEREIEQPVFKEVYLYDAKGKKKIGKHQIPVMETYEEEIDVLYENKQPMMVGSGKFETKTRPKINPDYDETKEYIPREKRPEWNCVGLLGQLPLRKGQPTAPSWIKIKDISKDVELWLVK